MKIKTGIRLHNKKSKNAGFTLVELLLSISILAIISVPLLNNFVIVSRANQKAENMQTQTQLGQNIIEEIKSKSVLDIAKEFDFPNEFPSYDADEMFEAKLLNGNFVKISEASNKSIKKTTYIDDNGISNNQYTLTQKTTEPYYFAIHNIVEGGKSYDALITLDSTAYIKQDALGDSYGYNTYQMPIISEIDTDKNAVAVQEYEEEEALTQLYANHIAYNAKQEALNKDNPSYSIKYYSKEEIRNQLSKKMTVNITKAEASLKVCITFIYSCTIEGCGETSSTIVEKPINELAGSIYIFYNPNYQDTITVNEEALITEPIDVYAVKQSTGRISTKETLSGTLPDNVSLYSNANFDNKSLALVKEDNSQNRIYDVKIQLFTAGSNFNAADLCLELNSTKEE
jgi:prepilin-type N-terminal cleavage/methylation domain-containing protein